MYKYLYVFYVMYVVRVGYDQIFHHDVLTSFIKSAVSIFIFCGSVVIVIIIVVVVFIEHIFYSCISDLLYLCQSFVSWAESLLVE